MDAIILAGGLGTRLKEAVKDLPKPMAGVAGRPFLSYLLEYLESFGTKRVILSVGYRSGKIKGHFRASYRSIDIDYVDEDSPLGTGGAVREAIRAVSGDDFLVLNGDSFFKVDLKALKRFHLERKSVLTMALRPMRGFDRYGSVSVSNGIVTGFTEKGFRSSGYINGGVYAMNRRIEEHLEGFGRRFSFETDFLGARPFPFKINGFISGAYFIDIGIPEDYAKAQTELQKEFRG